MGAPNTTDYLALIRGIMGIPLAALPDDALVIQYSFDASISGANLAFNALAMGQSTVYANAVYNLAGDMLINFANDQDGRTYFKDLRTRFNINNFQPGVISSSSDTGTSTSLLNPEFMKTLTLSDLQNLKTPFGRQYLMIAQAQGTLWGLS